MEEKGKWYWFWRHIWEGMGAFAVRHKFIVFPFLIAMIAVIYMLRAVYHPYALLIREHSILFTFFLPAAIALWVFRRRIGWKKGIAAWVLFLGTITILFCTHFGPVKYVALYWRYRTLDKVVLKELPTTAHERIQPLSSYMTRSSMALSENEVVAMPHLVRDGSEYRVTIGVEKAYRARQVTGYVATVFSVSATSPSPDFSANGSREAVHFETGEHLRFKKNVRVAAIRSLPFYRFISYWPTEDVRYMRNDQKEWVQVVPLARWSGWFFPHKEFGGVIVIPQQGAKYMYWVKPEDVSRHPFLTRQAIVPHEVSRYIGLSFRFRRGFRKPMPYYHDGDLRIPDLEGDVVPLPFTVHLDFHSKEYESKLYQYLGMEPYSPTKYGLAVSVFVPADSIGPVFEYPHADYNEIVTGSSSIRRVVKDSNKIIDWSANSPVEHRPFIRIFQGEKTPRFSWLTTVVAKQDAEDSNDKEANQFSGVNPDIVLVDGRTNTTVWVDAHHPEEWVKKLQERIKSSQSKKNSDKDTYTPIHSQISFSAEQEKAIDKDPYRPVRNQTIRSTDDSFWLLFLLGSL